MNFNLAPVALFVYNRPQHMLECLDSLKLNDEARYSDLYIFSDGAKCIEDKPKVEAVRHLLKKIEGFKSVNVIFREKNYGLSKSIISGVTEIVEIMGKVIVLEDDLILSKYFLKYMNEALNLYTNTSEVASIHGYLLPVSEQLPETFLLKGADCFGWGTWKRAWDRFDQNGTSLLNKLKQQKLARLFDLDGAVKNMHMLREQIAGKNNSWAIRWHASAFLNNQFTLFPKQSLVDNIGFDGTGTHCNIDNSWRAKIYQHPIKVEPIQLIECQYARNAVKKFYLQITPSISERIIRKAKKVLKAYV